MYQPPDHDQQNGMATNIKKSISVNCPIFFWYSSFHVFCLSFSDFSMFLISLSSIKSTEDRVG